LLQFLQTAGSIILFAVAGNRWSRSALRYH